MLGIPLDEVTKLCNGMLQSFSLEHLLVFLGKLPKYTLKNDEATALQARAKALGVTEDVLLQQALHHVLAAPLVLPTAASKDMAAIVTAFMQEVQEVSAKYRALRGYKFNRQDMYAEDERQRSAS